MRTYYTERPEEVELVYTASGTTVAFVRTDIQEEEEGFSAIEHSKVFKAKITSLTPEQIEEIAHPLEPMSVEEKLTVLEDAIVELASLVGGE